jgi:RimJ/RimL family protein N-acetyltransferase
MADHVTLRPVREDDLPVLEDLTWDPEIAGEFARFGWFDLGMWRRAWAADQMIGADGGALMVLSGDVTAGFVSWRRRPCTPAAYYWEIGVGLLPQARGRGLGTEAQRLLARYLFAHTPVNRIEARTETGNVAEQRALEKAGFTREGVVRGCGWRDGQWRDGAIYGLIRADLPASTDPDTPPGTAETDTPTTSAETDIPPGTAGPTAAPAPAGPDT